jgi:hypothetical protein
MSRTSLTFAALLTTGMAVFSQGGSTQQILQVARNTWPGPQTVGIVCNYARSGEAVRAMLRDFTPGSSVKVLDVRTTEHLATACNILWRVPPQYILLLPDDPFVHDGSIAATEVIHRMNFKQIPTLATTPAALAQGAWAVVGPATDGVLKVNPALQGYVDAYGTPMAPARPSARYGGGGAPTVLTVVQAF